MLPSEGLSESRIYRQVAEPHWRSLLPHLLASAHRPRQLSLLHSFSQLYAEAPPSSATKSSCLGVMEALLVGGQVAEVTGGGQGVDLPPEVVQRWLQSMPQLLWELKTKNPSVTQVRSKNSTTLSEILLETPFFVEN